VREHREDTPVVIRGGQQFELREDAGDVGLNRFRGEE
jgi:hypothetical protein